MSVQRWNAYRYRIDEFPPESAAPRLSQVAYEHVRARDGRGESSQNRKRDTRIRTEIRERGREIGRRSERKKMQKGRKKQEENGEGWRKERERKRNEKVERGYRMKEADEWKTQKRKRKRSGGRKGAAEPLLQREIGERRKRGNGKKMRKVTNVTVEKAGGC